MRPLLAEDLLLLLRDERGSTRWLVAGPEVPLGAAVLAELALDGVVGLTPSRPLRQRTVEVSGPVPADPLLAVAIGLIGERPRIPGDAARRIGAALGEGLAARIGAVGVERVERLRAGLRATSLDPCAAALAGILGEAGRLPAVLGLRGREAREAVVRVRAAAEPGWVMREVRVAMAS